MKTFLAFTNGLMLGSIAMFCMVVAIEYDERKTKENEEKEKNNETGLY